jgi:MFS family permease
MFLTYAAPGALIQLYSLHLQQLQFSPMLIGLCSAMQALATVLMALLVGQAADRWFSAERCVAVCAVLAGSALWLLSYLSGPFAILAVTLLYWLVTNPLLILCTTICFTHLRHPEKDFGAVRLWGTVGWMVPSWLLLSLNCLNGWEHPTTTSLFRVGSAFAFALGLYAWTLPHSPPRANSVRSPAFRRSAGPSEDGTTNSGGRPGVPTGTAPPEGGTTKDGGRRAAPLVALGLLGSRSFAAFCFCTIGVCLTFPFTQQATPLLLERLGIPVKWLGPTLTAAQVSEVLTLALLPMLLLRLGLRGTMVLGLAAWTTSLCVLAMGQPLALVVGSLPLNGLCVTGFLVAGQVFVNRRATGEVRASVQSLLTFVNGLGMLTGHLLVGWLRWLHGGDLPQAFTVGAGITGLLLVVFLIGFREPTGRP